MRIVREVREIDDAYARCQSEARAAFGNSDVYVEQLLPWARHIEVQMLGDANGKVAHLWERDCSLQRRHQKLIEIAPSPWITPDTRAALIHASERMAAEASLHSLCTFEFLIDATSPLDQPRFYFIEANPRLQVEHTVTEEVTGVDLVAAQIELAAGRSLSQLGLDDAQRHPPRGLALQARVYAETLDGAGAVRPATGTIVAFESPNGRGVRVETHAYAGHRQSTAFDALLAKVIVSAASGGMAQLLAGARRALRELRVQGVSTNAGLLDRILAHPSLALGDVHTTFVEQHLGELLTAEAETTPAFFAPAEVAARAGAVIDPNDPLAVLAHGKTAVERPALAPDDIALPEGVIAVRAPLQGTVIAVDVTPGDLVRRGERVLVMEAMKMEHVIVAPRSGEVRTVNVTAGDAVLEGATLLLLDATEVEGAEVDAADHLDTDVIRPDLAEVIDRHAAGLDDRRPAAVERRRKTHQRTARENIEDLCDPGSFVEYGPLVIAAQRRRRTVEELIEQTPADGLIAGIGTVNAGLFGEERARCIAMSYDYTVLAGTQGQQNHRKKDRMFELAEKWRLPIVFFTEGGGGRPGDTDGLGVAGLDCMAFHYFGRLSGSVPLVGIVSGRCFAGNAALLGCCDVIIATKDANIGMGGPAMIEGGGLGVFRPDEVGPTGVQAPNGVIDLLVDDEAQATAVAKRYLSYMQGAVDRWSCSDQRVLRGVIPENRRRVYDIRKVIDLLADEGSVLELRRQFGHGMITSLIRIEGRPMGLIANNPMHLAGAIDSDAADKAARFMQLCDAFDLPILSLCDTPGIMVGPEVEKTALVRHASRMFVTGASVTVPMFTIILRKAYGLGAQAMAGGSFKAPFFTVSWPTGEFGGMGLEGAVKLGYRNELAAITDPEQRKATFEEMVERMYRHGKAVNTASHFEIDDVVDPMDTRRWITGALRSLPPTPPRTEKKRSCIDTW
jgi:acetyl-CoA carboxylase carboxyltransferase component/biotin carboxyl carrier protein